MKRGFTLIELLVVVLIIDILSAIALPQYQQTVLKSRYVQAKTMASALAQAQEIYYIANGTYSHSFDELDIDTPGYLEEGNNFTTDGVNRPYRAFSWGYCYLWEQGITACYLDYAKYGLGYISVGRNSTDSNAGKKRCIAYNTDLSSQANKLCKNETGKQSPTETGDTYLYWNY